MTLWSANSAVFLDRNGILNEATSERQTLSAAAPSEKREGFLLILLPDQHDVGETNHAERW
jgi:hypothetical protein